MNVTVSGTYESADAARNVEEQLVAYGIPQENIFVDEDARQIKVTTPEATKPEIVAILNQHKPTRVT